MYNSKFADNCNSYFQPEYAMIRDIEEYIYNELKDSKYYSELSTKAPTKFSKDILVEFAEDDRIYAECFIKAYSLLTGMVYDTPVIKELQVPEYAEALKECVLCETQNYKKYNEQYLKTRNQYIKELFFTASSVKAIHAMRLPLLIGEK